MLGFVYLNKETPVRDLRKVEDNFIAGIQPNMNRKGKYRCKIRCSILARVEKNGKFSTCSVWRKKLAKRYFGKKGSPRVVSGRLSKFFLSYSPNKISYNLFAIIEDGCAKGQGLVSVSCVFGCPYSDITSYDYLYITNTGKQWWSTRERKCLLLLL